MNPDGMRSRRGRFLWMLAGGVVAAMAAGAGKGTAQEGAARAPNESGENAPANDGTNLRVIQGRITAIDGNLLTVKTPDGYPGGGPGMHAQFVARGPEFRVDISAGRVLLPDGKQEDRQPLAVGERVVAVLREPTAVSSETVNPLRAAAVVERVSTSDRVVTH